MRTRICVYLYMRTCLLLRIRVNVNVPACVCVCVFLSRCRDACTWVTTPWLIEVYVCAFSHARTSRNYPPVTHFSHTVRNARTKHPPLSLLRKCDRGPYLQLVFREFGRAGLLGAPHSDSAMGMMCSARGMHTLSGVSTGYQS